MQETNMQETNKFDFLQSVELCIYVASEPFRLWNDKDQTVNLFHKIGNDE